MDTKYVKLLEALSAEQKILLNEFCECESAYIGLEKERAYSNGFKTGVWLGLVLMDFKPENF